MFFKSSDPIVEIILLRNFLLSNPRITSTSMGQFVVLSRVVNPELVVMPAVVDFWLSLEDTKICIHERNDCD